MELLLKKYSDQLAELKTQIQSSAVLEKYLDSEEDEDYQPIREEFESKIHDLYTEVADLYPMQLISFENELLDPDFEGLYLPKMLGYSILRGAIDSQYRYIRPQEQFKKILLAICSSSNFDVLKLRIGQSIKTGFALSSDIWISNLVQSIPTKQVRHFLENQKLPKYFDPKQREIAYKKFQRQFHDLNFFTAEFPSQAKDLHILYPELKLFLVSRIKMEKSSENLWTNIQQFAGNEAYRGSKEFTYILGLIANYFDLNDGAAKSVRAAINETRISHPNFEEGYFEFLKDLGNSDLIVDYDCHQRMSALIDKSNIDNFTKYYGLMDIINAKGWTHEESIEAVKEFYYQHAGLSTINECVRLTIYKLFEKIVLNLGAGEYPQIFELFKYITAYTQVFDNEHFNLAVKNLTLKYVKKLTKKVYTDKRGRDYQDIKKFIASTFVDLNFMTPKEVKEFFLTKRKKKEETK